METLSPRARAVLADYLGHHPPHSAIMLAPYYAMMAGAIERSTSYRARTPEDIAAYQEAAAYLRSLVLEELKALRALSEAQRTPTSDDNQEL